jgi:hypothetical protein
MKITYRADAPQEKVDAVDTDTLACWRFVKGETQDIPDDLARRYLRNRHFVDAATGKNPFYTCIDCGAETFDTARSRPAGAVSLREPDGTLRCVPCHEKYVPPASKPELEASAPEAATAPAPQAWSPPMAAPAED